MEELSGLHSCIKCGTTFDLAKETKCPRCLTPYDAKYCFNCDYPYRSKYVDKYCPKCGLEFGLKHLICPECGGHNNLDFVYCTHCGMKL